MERWLGTVAWNGCVQQFMGRLHGTVAPPYSACSSSTSGSRGSRPGPAVASNCAPCAAHSTSPCAVAPALQWRMSDFKAKLV